MTGASLQPDVRRNARALTLVELLVVLGILAGLAALMIPIFSDLGVRAYKDGPRISPQGLATMSTMNTVRDAIMGTPDAPGYFKDMGDYPRPGQQGQQPVNCGSAGFVQRGVDAQLRYLYVNPFTETSSSQDPDPEKGWDPVLKKGWRGPYLQASGRYRLDLSSGFTTRYGDEIDIFCNDGGDPAPVDGWGNPIVIQEPTGFPLNARIVSAGSNGVIDTDPDDPIASDRGDDVVTFLRIPDPDPPSEEG